MKSLKYLLVFCLTMAWIAACGGSGSSYGQTNASPGGIWNGTESTSGLSVVGLVDEAGAFHFIRSDGVQYVGNATTSGNNISANFSGYTPFGTTFADGSTSGTGTLSGTIQARSSVSANTTFKTAAGTMSSGTLMLTFNAIYDNPSSLSAISSNYTDPSSGDVISVTGSGAISWQDATTGCVGNGMVSIINASYDAYEVTFDYGNCNGAAAVLNGVQFSGLATLDTAVNPTQAIIGVTGMAGSVTYAIVYDLDKS